MPSQRLRAGLTDAAASRLGPFGNKRSKQNEVSLRHQHGRECPHNVRALRSFFGNCGPGARQEGFAQPGAPGRGAVPGLGFRCHDGRKNRQRVEIGFPSRLLGDTPEAAPGRSVAGCASGSSDPPEGMPGQPRPGEVTAIFPSAQRDGLPRRGDAKSPQLASRPWFFPVRAPFLGVFELPWDA